jgi:hypothetical protein
MLLFSLQFALELSPSGVEPLYLSFRFFERVHRFLQLHVVGGDGRIFHASMAGCQLGLGG